VTLPRPGLPMTPNTMMSLERLPTYCLCLLASLAFTACSDGGRPRQLNQPGVLHDNGGGGGAGGGALGLGGNGSLGGSSGDGDGDDELDAGTGGYQIGTDWDGNTSPTADHAHGIDAAAGVEARGDGPPEAGADGG
jgi:hypothetical protein